MKTILLVLLTIPVTLFSQYCIPTQGKPAVAPVIDGVSIGTIQNTNSGYALTDYGYSDYTDQSTAILAGSTQTITIETGDFWPHNVGIWIDYNKDEVFTDDEAVAIFELGGNNPMTQEITFDVPTVAVHGYTRMRVRGMLEPFGPWMLSMHPCLPAEGDGEIEDYTIEILGGVNESLDVSRIIEPVSAVDIGESQITAVIGNNGNSSAENIEVTAFLDGSEIMSDVVPLNLIPGATLVYTFSDTYDFSNISCSELTVEVSWPQDEILTDNVVTTDLCKLEPVTGDEIWYIHSNINGGIEPLGGEPFYSTTNEVSMNTVFGENNWQQGYFETVDAEQLFSESSCTVFLDGSYDHSGPIETFILENQLLIENWVAAGGNLFLNCAKELGDLFYVNVGFDDTMISFYSVIYASPASSHEILDGSYQPLSNDYTGFYYAVGVIVGEDLETVVHETNDNGIPNAPVLNMPILAEKDWGQGTFVVGALGASQLVTPAAESMNLRANVLEYVSGCEVSTSVSETELGQIKLYPNPNSTGNVMIDLPENLQGSSQVEIYSISGSLVNSRNLVGSGSVQLDTSDLSPGLYTVILSNEKQGLTGKLIIQ